MKGRLPLPECKLRSVSVGCRGDDCGMSRPTHACHGNHGARDSWSEKTWLIQTVGDREGLKKRLWRATGSRFSRQSVPGFVAEAFSTASAMGKLGLTIPLAGQRLSRWPLHNVHDPEMHVPNLRTVIMITATVAAFTVQCPPLPLPHAASPPDSLHPWKKGCDPPPRCASMPMEYNPCILFLTPLASPVTATS